MQFTITTWTIKAFIDVHERGQLDLSPPYQRNAVWTAKSQQRLLQSILSGKAIPNFFLLQKRNGAYEMIDGQQRARTILGYWKNMLVDHENLTFEQRVSRSTSRHAANARLLDYQLSITIVTALGDDESIEDYYALLNSSGLRLNRPELKKAEYFTTNFLKLILELSMDERLQNLKLFTILSSARMNDVDFVSELLALMKFGISDKKEKVDQLYEDDITLTEFRALKGVFSEMLEHSVAFNNIHPICRTRYKQKNDFYTIFYIFFTLRNVERSALEAFYRLLVKIGPHIRPSQEECEPLRQYAYHCVTQSNSKASRQERHDILSALLLGKTREPNAIQRLVLTYFGLSVTNMVQIGNYWTIDAGAIRDPHNHEFEFVDDEI